MSDPPILLVDDDRDLAELLVDFLGTEGFTIEAVHDGRRGLARALTGGFRLVVLDVMLPGMSGLEVLRELRKASATPVLMLTARGDDDDRIAGLELGADDYLAKPFNPRELVARIRAVLRRSDAVVGAPAPTPDPGVLVVGDVEVRPGAMTCRVAGAPVELTSAELGFLVVLLENVGEVVSRDTLCERVLERPLAPFDRSVDVHVSNLRKKLGKDAADGERIKSVRGVGYLYADDAGAT